MIVICDLYSPINWPELLISTGAGTAIGYFISLVASRNYERKKHARELIQLNREFEDLAGVYENHYHEGKIIATKISDAKLEYYADRGKTFKITVTTYTDGNSNPLSKEEIQVWEGEINMVDKRFGDLSFNYIAPERMKSKVGFKRIIFSQNGKVMSLVGEIVDGHYNEIFDKRISI